MRHKLTAVFVVAVTALAADEGWKKVQELKSGTEIRVYKRDARQPVTGRFDEADSERLLFVLKNEQTAIQKDDIDRVDARPSRTGGRVTSETKTNTIPENRPATPVPNQGTGAPGSSTSSSVSVGSKPDFEIIYRRTASPRSK